MCQASGLAVLLLLAHPLHGQEGGTITGRVTDAQSLQPLSSAQVSIPELGVGALTQQNGRFILVNVPAGTRTVTVQRIGYRPATEAVTVVAGQSVTLDFPITEEALALDEIIVTGTPGGTQRRAIGNTVTRVNAAQVTEQVAISSMQDLLTARTPGLSFSRVSGSIGTGSGIQIRGTGSFSLGAQPLIYIDGVRMDNSNRAGPATNSPFQMNAAERGGGESSILDDLNPEDIESIEVIKGPAAATLYGTEASAGVIQIITKKGGEGAPQFNLSINQGANFMRDPAGKLGDQFACRTRTSPPCPEGEMFRYNMYEEASAYISGAQPGPDGGLYFEWPSDNLYQYGHAQAYNLDVRGGTAAVRYFLSAGIQDDEGAVWYNWDRTNRFRANVSALLTDDLSIDVSTGYIDGEARLADPSYREGGHWQDMLWNNGYYLLRINPDAQPRVGGFQERLPSDVAKIEALRDYTRFTGSATINHNLGDWFTQRAVVGVDRGWEINEVIYPIDTGQPVYPQTRAGEHNYAKPVTTNSSFDYAASFKFNLRPGLLTTTSVGAQYYTETFETVDMQGFGYASPLSRSIDQTVLSRINLQHDYIENKSLGVYVQEEIGLNDRLFLTGAVRFDDNSAFGSDFNAQIYPKVSAAWVVSEESFWNFNLVNQFRLRGALGKAGRQPDTFAGTFVYSVVPGPGGTTALWPQSPGNPDVGPEISTELEAGFDYAVLNDRLSGDFTYFYQKNEDALLGLGVAPSIGFPGSVQQNVGRIDNWGWEATLNASVYNSPNVAFDLALSGDHTMNEIKDLGSYPGSTYIRIGYPYPSQIHFTHVNEADWDPNGAIRTAYGQGITGMCDTGVPLGDTPQHGKVLGGPEVNCLQAIGANMLAGPNFFTHTWSVAPTLTLFQDLQVFALAEGKYGRTGWAAVEQWAHEYNTTEVAILENDPMWVLQDRLFDYRSKAYYDADFWKLREVGARYSLPQSIVSRTGADRASLAVSGRNLQTLWTAQSHINGRRVADPEFEGPSGFGSYYQQPPLSSFAATLRVSF
ncbi:MAG: TonB-dependent receptor [Gemmatimonadota bacterium]